MARSASTTGTPVASTPSGICLNGGPAPYKVPKFLRSLYAILQTEDPNIIAWVQNQELKPNRVTAFHILDMERFEQEILPKYFKHQKFASFQRQLNNFGFRKWTKTQSSGVCTFSHNCFPPDPQLIGVMRASLREQWRHKSGLGAPTTTGSGRRKASGRGKNAKENKALAPTAAALKAAAMAASPTGMGARLTSSPRAKFRASMSFNDLLRTDIDEHGTVQWGKSSNQSDKKVKKPTRPLQEMKGAVSATEHDVKACSLPSLQPMSVHATSSPALVECSVNLAGFPTHSVFGGMVFGHDLSAKPMEFYDRASGESCEDLNGEAILEPWCWETQGPPTLDFSTFPVESFDWQENVSNCPPAGLQSSGVSSSSSNVSTLTSAASKESMTQCHQPERGLPTTADSDFGLDNLLFVE
ncbi:TPA: hypothetical protein N0F65_002798 [Lagenidium giganteum]|uniref:HSF-type DNA-binding domain-containing protein n=1 Tax=Lagenidium giganteum TaxID=4803 RepID=A0AAV2YNX2_9STRA|nr:TPA: hypothetical protein N0F65_002798 [Lagenidium giganteum]